MPDSESNYVSTSKRQMKRARFELFILLLEISKLSFLRITKRSDSRPLYYSRRPSLVFTAYQGASAHTLGTPGI